MRLILKMFPVVGLLLLTSTQSSSTKLSDCLDCSRLYRKTGVQINRKDDCCGGCIDGYVKIDVYYDDKNNYRCREAYPALQPTGEDSSTTLPYSTSTVHSTSVPSEETMTHSATTIFNPPPSLSHDKTTKEGSRPWEVVGIVSAILIAIIIVFGALCIYLKKKWKTKPGCSAKSQNNVGSQIYKKLSSEDPLRKLQSDTDLEYDNNNGNMTEEPAILHTRFVYQEEDKLVCAVPIREFSETEQWNETRGNRRLSNVQTFPGEFDRMSEANRDSAIGLCTPCISKDGSHDPLADSDSGFNFNPPDVTEPDTISNGSTHFTGESSDKKTVQYFHVTQCVNINVPGTIRKV